MLSLEFLRGPLMNAAGKLPGMPTPGTGTTAPKPMLGGMFGKAGKLLSPLPTADAGAPPVPPRLATPNVDPLATRMPAVRLPETAPTVEETPIPSLPGRTGGPRPFDPQTKAEFDYVMKNVPRDEAGNERKLTFGERFKKSLIPALLGTVQGINSPAGQRNPIGGAIGGAAAGFAGGMIDPISARQYEWNQMYKPEMDAQQAAREEMNAERQKNEEGLIDLEARRADIGRTKAQTEATSAGMKDAGLERDYRQSQIDANRALEQQRLRMKPIYHNVVIEGRPQTIERFPDGTQRVLGDSEKAYLQEQGLLSKETIVDKQIAGRKDVAEMNAAEAMKRTAIKQGGKQTGKPGSAPAKLPAKSTPKTSRQAFIDRAVAEGYSRAEAEAFANNKGLK